MEFMAKSEGKAADYYQKRGFTEEQAAEGMKRMIEIEMKKPLNLRSAVGDASETGLIKFYQGINDLEEERAKYPKFVYNNGEKDQECTIPFSSEIKFNLNIRNMNKINDYPQNE